MKIIKRIFLTCTMFTIFSCDPCRNMDCLHNDYEAEFRLVDKQNGKELLFGPSKIYDKSKLKFYSIDDSDTINYPYSAVKQYGTEDSILNVEFYPGDPDIVYFKLSNSDIDTMAIEYKRYNTECCGMITEIVKLRYNNLYDIPGKGVQEIKK